MVNFAAASELLEDAEEVGLGAAERRVGETKRRDEKADRPLGDHSVEDLAVALGESLPVAVLASVTSPPLAEPGSFLGRCDERAQGGRERVELCRHRFLPRRDLEAAQADRRRQQRQPGGEVVGDLETRTAAALHRIDRYVGELEKTDLLGHRHGAAQKDVGGPRVVAHGVARGADDEEEHVGVLRREPFEDEADRLDVRRMAAAQKDRDRAAAEQGARLAEVGSVFVGTDVDAVGDHRQPFRRDPAAGELLRVLARNAHDAAGARACEGLRLGHDGEQAVAIRMVGEDARLEPDLYVECLVDDGNVGGLGIEQRRQVRVGEDDGVGGALQAPVLPDQLGVVAAHHRVEDVAGRNHRVARVPLRLRAAMLRGPRHAQLRESVADSHLDRDQVVAQAEQCHLEPAGQIREELKEAHLAAVLQGGDREVVEHEKTRVARASPAAVAATEQVVDGVPYVLGDGRPRVALASECGGGAAEPRPPPAVARQELNCPLERFHRRHDAVTIVLDRQAARAEVGRDHGEAGGEVVEQLEVRSGARGDRVQCDVAGAKEEGLLLVAHDAEQGHIGRRLRERGAHRAGQRKVDAREAPPPDARR